MATRTNLSPNPACKVDATGWWGSAGAGPVTGLTGLPRTTGFSNPAGVSAVLPQAVVTAGVQHTLSVSIAPQASGTVSYGVDWRSVAGGYLSSTPVATLVAAAGSVYRLQVSGTAPAGADRALMTVSLPTGTLILTAYLAEPTAGPAGDYFDGDSTAEQPGWTAVWDGVDGKSTSTLTFSAVSALLQLGALSVSALGHITSTGTALVPFDHQSIITGVIVTAIYDGHRGRVRLLGSGWPGEVIRAVVYHRPAGTSRWIEVRGGRVAVTGGQFGRTVDDYEYTAGAVMQYRVLGLSSAEEAVDVVVQGKVVDVDLATVTTGWIKFIASPSRNVAIQLVGWSAVQRPSRVDLYQVRGRRDPIAVTDLHGARQLTVQLRTTTVPAGEALDEALSSGFPALLHLPAGLSLPSMYCVIRDYEWTRPAARSLVRRWDVALTEVAAPPPSIVGAGRTWQTLLDTYQTWADLLDATSSWLDVVD